MAFFISDPMVRKIRPRKDAIYVMRAAKTLLDYHVIAKNTANNHPGLP